MSSTSAVVVVAKKQNENPKIKPINLIVKIKRESQIERYEVSVLPTSTIKDLKRIISKIVLCRIELFNLIHRDKILQFDQAKLSDYKIKDNSIVTVILRHMTGGYVVIKRVDTRESFSVDYEMNDTIDTLKKRISSLCDLPIESQIISARLLNIKKNIFNSTLLKGNVGIGDVTNKCHNEFYLNIDKRYVK